MCNVIYIIYQQLCIKLCLRLLTSNHTCRNKVLPSAQEPWFLRHLVEKCSTFTRYKDTDLTTSSSDSCLFCGTISKINFFNTCRRLFQRVNKTVPTDIAVSRNVISETQVLLLACEKVWSENNCIYSCYELYACVQKTGSV